MRVREPFKKSGKKRPKAASLRGSIVCVCNNVISDTISPKPPTLEKFFTGTIQGSFFTDSNSTTYDGKYTPSEATGAELTAAAKQIPYPYFGLWQEEWESGRLLATVGKDLLYDHVGGSTALYGYRNKGGPLLPHWSWLFDYAAPALTQKKEIKAATYATGEATLDGAHSGDLPRNKTDFVWPVGSKYRMTIQKQGRQGQYDNIHIHASMPQMQAMKPLVAAPFCGDMCMHLHWRWGIDSTSSLAAPYAFYGWGATGQGADGAHSSSGAPLIPPNQHLRVVGEPGAGNATFTLTYDVTAQSPGIGEWQVFMEQGMAIAFSYAIGGLSYFCSPLNTITFPGLLGALGVLGPQALFGDDLINNERKRLVGLLKSGKPTPELDAAIRLRFHDIYAVIRYYDKTLDGYDVEQIPTYDATLESL
jgi:hypothetical protein